MSIKQIGQQLNAYECIQLLDKIAEYRVANIKRDEKNSDNLIVCMKNPFEESYRSVPISDCAKMLASDLNAQTFLREQLKQKGVELVEFADIQQALAAYL
jgi:hypothetical protein